MAEDGEEVDTGSGIRWFDSSKGPYLVELDSDEVDLFVSASSKRQFTNPQTVSGVTTYDPPLGWRATLESESITDTKDYDDDNSTSDSFTVYRLTLLDSGDILIFAGYDSATASGTRGHLVEQTNRDFVHADWDGTLFTYGSNGFVDLVTLPAESATPAKNYSAVYAYVTSGVEQDRLESIKVYDGPPPGATGAGDLIMQAEYTYGGNISGTPSGDIGGNGDLVQVKVSELASNGTDWID